MAEAMVGIARVERAPRHPWNDSTSLSRTAVLHPVVVDVLRERLDVAVVGVERLDEPQRRDRRTCARCAATASSVEAVVLAAYCGYSGSTRIFSHCCAAQLVDRGRRCSGCRSACRSRPGTGRTGSPARFSCWPRNPSSSVRWRTLCTSSGEPSLVQIARYRLADRDGRVLRMTPCRSGFHAQRGDLHDAGVGQELREVATHRARRRSVGRAEVGEQDSDARRAVVREGRLGSVSQPVISSSVRASSRSRAGPPTRIAFFTNGAHPSAAPFGPSAMRLHRHRLNVSTCDAILPSRNVKRESILLCTGRPVTENV